jgi:predicted metal-dependent HD superfamily phosphohydrolase
MMAKLKIDSDHIANQCIRESRQAAYDLLDQLSPNLYYHGKSHTLDIVVPTMRRLCRMQQLPPGERTLHVIAADWHDVGYTQRYWGNEAVAARLLREWMQASDYLFTDADIDYATNAILATDLKHGPLTLIDCNIRDADVAYLGANREIFLDTERELMKELRAQPPALEQIMWRKAQDDREWNRFSLDFMTSHDWFTSEASYLFNAQKRRNIYEFIYKYGLHDGG